MREITLQEMLAARERRAFRQRELLERYEHPLISFTMNIPGPVKDSFLIRRAFSEGVKRLDAVLASRGADVLSREQTFAPTGPELLLTAAADAKSLKALCTEIEEHDALGRLFDMDVLSPGGEKLDRAIPRRCIICGKPGKECSSRRLHPLDELWATVTDILESSLLRLDAARVSGLATKALIDEVNTTPKPGLVDRNNNGSHRDMCPETFFRSAEALREYWSDCFLLGRSLAGQTPEETFARLRQRGAEADRAMLAATGGVNTHKGAIFTLGTVCGAVGRLWSGENGPCADPAHITAEASALCRRTVEADFAILKRRGTADTMGERLYLKYGLKGVRGELADGLPGAVKYAIPVLEEMLSEGYSRNDAGVAALLHLVARGSDSNMIARGGIEEARRASREAAALLPRPSMEEVLALDRSFISRNLSPGGCADLLAISYFLCDWKREVMEIKNSADGSGPETKEMPPESAYQI